MKRGGEHGATKSEVCGGPDRFGDGYWGGRELALDRPHQQSESQATSNGPRLQRAAEMKPLRSTGARKNTSAQLRSDDRTPLTHPQKLPLRAYEVPANLGATLLSCGECKTASNAAAWHKSSLPTTGKTSHNVSAQQSFHGALTATVAAMMECVGY